MAWGRSGPAPLRWRTSAAAATILATLAMAGAWAYDARLQRRLLATARREVGANRFDDARPRLARLSARRVGQGEVEFLLGACEAALDHPDAALLAWARVPLASPWGEEAAVRRARLAIDRGRLAEAEEALLATLGERRRGHVDARHQLAVLWWREARFDEVRTLIEASWDELERDGRLPLPKALEWLRGHLAIDFETWPIEDADAFLRRASGLAPDDDRVWLAQARWDLRAGRFERARRLIDRCIRRRPEDLAAWRTALDLARASGAVDDARRALAHLPSARADEREVLDLRAWLANRRGDHEAERGCLDRLVAIDPGDLAALARLASLDALAGRAGLAADRLRRKRELDRDLQRYRNAYKDDALDSRAGELAGLAESLGRTFEAIGFLTLALRRDPENREWRDRLARLRAAPRHPPAGAAGQSLATVLAADLRPAATTGTPETAAAAATEFRDDSRRSGLNSFAFRSGTTTERQLPEVMSGGVGVLDYDGDGRLDVYLVQGGTFPPLAPAKGGVLPQGDRLFRNRGDGTFEDVTRRSGLAAFPGGYGHGVAVGDIDNDRDPDLFVTRWRGYALYRNRGDGSFEDATAAAGLGGPRGWPTSSAFADLDGDGDLDLYVCHYLAWDADHPKLCPGATGGRYLSCDPRHFEAEPDRVFRNDRGRFVDVTADAGIVDREGRGLGVVASDLDDDGRVDLFVANDGSANFAFLSRGGFRFEESAHLMGLAGNAEGGYQAGMGVACGDLDGDGRIDLAVTNFYGESTTFFQNLGGGTFADRTRAIGLAAPSRPLLGFGIALFDGENDGRLDLLTANGHVNDLRPQFAHAMPLQYLRGGAGGRLDDLSARAGPPFRVSHLGRGLAIGDLDDDGRVDAIVVAQDEPTVVLRNRTEGGHALWFRLEGAVSNRDGVGARVAVVAAGRRQTAARFGGGSYLSAGDGRLHFGLGPATRAEEVEVRWPSGGVDHHRDIEADRGYLLREGNRHASPLAGPPPKSR